MPLRAALLVLPVFLVGCVPAKYIEAPAIRGRVVDVDGQPVQGATIRVLNRNGKPAVTATSAADGSFATHELGKIVLQFAGADWFSHELSVTATDGTRSAPVAHVRDGMRRWFIVFYDPPVDRDVGDLRLDAGSK